MKIGIMQPYFFPYIGYWQLISAVDEYIVYDDVNYIKRGWINRNNILFKGQAKRINLHIRDASQNRLIRDTELAQTGEDSRILLENIKQCYHKAPYFGSAYNLIKNILNYPSVNLAEYLFNQIKTICDYLDIGTTILLSSNISKGENLKGEERIIAICKERGAANYINAIGGKKLYHQEKFEKEGMTVKFLKTEEIYYKQFENEFVPSLSIIDIMMFNEIDEIKLMLKKYELE